MRISEGRLQLLLPKRLKASLQTNARRMGLSAGEYVRRLIEADLHQAGRRNASVYFPFGEKPIHSGRKYGSVNHDRTQ